jgi:hypothetical protein
VVSEKALSSAKGTLTHALFEKEARGEIE